MEIFETKLAIANSARFSMRDLSIWFVCEVERDLFFDFEKKFKISGDSFNDMRLYNGVLFPIDKDIDDKNLIIKEGYYIKLDAYHLDNTIDFMKWETDIVDVIKSSLSFFTIYIPPFLQHEELEGKDGFIFFTDKSDYKHFEKLLTSYNLEEIKEYFSSLKHHRQFPDILPDCIDDSLRYKDALQRIFGNEDGISNVTKNTLNFKDHINSVYPLLKEMLYIWEHNQEELSFKGFPFENGIDDLRELVKNYEKWLSNMNHKISDNSKETFLNRANKLNSIFAKMLDCYYKDDNKDYILNDITCDDFPFNLSFDEYVCEFSGWIDDFKNYLIENEY